MHIAGRRTRSLSPGAECGRPVCFVSFRARRERRIDPRVSLRKKMLAMNDAKPTIAWLVQRHQDPATEEMRLGGQTWIH